MWKPIRSILVTEPLTLVPNEGEHGGPGLECVSRQFWNVWYLCKQICSFVCVT